jgi:hypothetical protein
MAASYFLFGLYQANFMLTSCVSILWVEAIGSSEKTSIGLYGVTTQKIVCFHILSLGLIVNDASKFQGTGSLQPSFTVRW